MTNLEINTPRIVWDRVDNEVVALDCVGGIYYRFNPAASDVWAALDAGATVDQLVAAGVDEQVLTAFLTELGDAEFLRQRTAPASVADVAVGDGSLEYERFDDLQFFLEADPIHEVEPRKGWKLGR